jgi:hypothetical protein
MARVREPELGATAPIVRKLARVRTSLKKCALEKAWREELTNESGINMLFSSSKENYHQKFRDPTIIQKKIKSREGK